MSDMVRISFEALSEIVEKNIKDIDTTIANEYHVIVNDDPKHPDSYINYKNKDGTYNRMIYSENPLDERSFETWSVRELKPPYGVCKKMIFGLNNKHHNSYIKMASEATNDFNYYRIVYGEDVTNPKSYEEFYNKKGNIVKSIVGDNENNPKSFIINFDDNGNKISIIFGNDGNNPRNSYYSWTKNKDGEDYLFKTTENREERFYNESGKLIKKIKDNELTTYETIVVLN